MYIIIFRIYKVLYKVFFFLTAYFVLFNCRKMSQNVRWKKAIANSAIEIFNRNFLTESNGARLLENSMKFKHLAIINC